MQHVLGWWAHLLSYFLNQSAISASLASFFAFSFAARFFCLCWAMTAAEPAGMLLCKLAAPANKGFDKPLVSQRPSKAARGRSRAYSHYLFDGWVGPAVTAEARLARSGLAWSATERVSCRLACVTRARRLLHSALPRSPTPHPHAHHSPAPSKRSFGADCISVNRLRLPTGCHNEHGLNTPGQAAGVSGGLDAR